MIDVGLINRARRVVTRVGDERFCAAVIGGFLLLQARQPPWLDTAGRWLWLRVQGTGLIGQRGSKRAAAGPFLLGLGWAFLPCGLLYSALLVAALSPGLWQGWG